MSSAAQVPYVPRIFVVRLEVSCIQHSFSCCSSCSTDYILPDMFFFVFCALPLLSLTHPSSPPFLFVFTSSQSCLVVLEACTRGSGRLPKNFSETHKILLARSVLPSDFAISCSPLISNVKCGYIIEF